MTTEGALLFLNEHEARALDAIAGRIIPGDAESPGAREAGATTYIDQALAGFHRDLQTFYRRALGRLDAECVAAHGAPFAELPEETQDAVLAGLEASGTADQGESELRMVSWEEEDLLSTFFEIAREHVLQGTFCDPAYGGNRDLAGWRMVGFPGTHWGYTPEQMQRGVDARLIPLKTLGDLRRERPWEGVA